MCYDVLRTVRERSINLFFYLQHRFTNALASLLSLLVIAINLWFVVNFLEQYMGNQWWMYLIVVAVGLFYFSLIIYLTLFLIAVFGVAIPVSTVILFIVVYI